MITIELFAEVKLLKNLTGFENPLGLEPKTFKVHKDVDFWIGTRQTFILALIERHV